MFREKKNVLMALSMSFIPFFAFAEGDGYVRLKENVDSVSYNTGFDTKNIWDEEVVKPSDRNYLISDNKIFSTKSGEIVPSRSMTFGEVNVSKGIYRAYYGVTFENEGVVFANGACWTHYKNAVINGNVSVVSPKEDPFIFYNDGYRQGHMEFTGKVSAEDDCVGGSPIFLA